MTTARLTKQKVIIPNVKENGTVYVQAEDAISAKNILILRVIAFKCPCEHNGICFQKKNISYPVQRSDYLCQCEEPYRSQKCELQPKPCDKQPCFRGLKCFHDQNFVGFICEKCQKLFEGDGKQCILKTTEGLEGTTNFIYILFFDTLFTNALNW